MAVIMKSWNSDDDRIQGSVAFERNLRLNHSELEMCKKDPAYARRKFAEWGQFYIEGELPDPKLGFPAYKPEGDIMPIPMATQFEVWTTDPKDVAERSERVILVVDLGYGPEKLNDAQVWRCTYSPYGTMVADSARNAPKTKSAQKSLEAKSK